MGALEDVPMEEGRRQMEVNLIGVARLTQLSLPHMRAQKLARSSISPPWEERCLRRWPVGITPQSSRWKGYSDALRMEVQPFGIDVIVIEPAALTPSGYRSALAEAERYSGQGAYGTLVRQCSSHRLGSARCRHRR